MRIRFRSIIPASAEQLFAWHVAPGAFGRLCPPLERIRMEGRDQGLRRGDVRILRIGPLRWVAGHDEWVDGRQFRDVQQQGPFSRWLHTHRCIPVSDHESVLEDDIDFRLPFGFPGGRLLESQIRRTFVFRHWRTRFDVVRRPALEQQGQKVVLSGASGLVGGQLISFLRVQGFQVVQLVRGPAGPGQVSWNPSKAWVERPEELEGALGFIHLSGHSVIDGNWSEAHRRSMWDSRIDSTRALLDVVNSLSQPPRVFVCASGVGYYGDQRQLCDETSPRGAGFLAELCEAWEAEAARARCRSVQLRIGAVLHPAGGMLGQLRLPFSLGLGATIGGGSTPVPWITMEDLLGVFLCSLLDERYQGPINAVAPQVAPFRAIADHLAAVLGRPRWINVPPWLLRPLLGRKLDLLLEGAPVEPARLKEWGFPFLLPSLYDGLRHELGLHGMWTPPGFSWEWLE